MKCDLYVKWRDRGDGMGLLSNCFCCQLISMFLFLFFLIFYFSAGDRGFGWGAPVELFCFQIIFLFLFSFSFFSWRQGWGLGGSCWIGNFRRLWRSNTVRISPKKRKIMPNRLNMYFNVSAVNQIIGHCRVLEVVRRNKGPSPKSLDSDENFKAA